MSGIARRLLRIVACVLAIWVVARIVFQFLPNQDEVAAMVLLLCVLAFATLADRLLAVAASLAAGLSFSYYFIYPPYSFRLNSVEDTVSFFVFIAVALVGSHLSLRSELRAIEVEQRRGEMARLHRLGAALLSADTVEEAANKAVREIVKQFGGGACLRVEGMPRTYQAGVQAPKGRAPIEIHTANRKGVLALVGVEPSLEVRSALSDLVGLVLDRAAVSEERNRIESVRRGDELRTTVLNALAHNFRTPLTSIKAAASMMRSAFGVPGVYSRELVEVIDEEADRLDELLQDSLDLARIQSRQSAPRVEDCSLESIVSRVVGKMARHFARHLVIVEIPDGLPAVRGDRLLLEQMIRQVLDNAWKYSEVGARIWISARHAGGEITVTIMNEGPPLPEPERTLVFDRFYRGSSGGVRVEGTGLGLAIAKDMAEAVGGRIWLDCESEGPAFRFALPAGSLVLEEENGREPHYIAD
jgi:two-component system sensor histidine kinase KdpD